MLENFIKAKDKPLIISLLAGLLIGVILTTSIKYPLLNTEIERVQKICKDAKIEKIKVGISGKIYELKCTDGITYKLSN